MPSHTGAFVPGAQYAYQQQQQQQQAGGGSGGAGGGGGGGGSGSGFPPVFNTTSPVGNRPQQQALGSNPAGVTANGARQGHVIERPGSGLHSQILGGSHQQQSAVGMYQQYHHHHPGTSQTPLPLQQPHPIHAHQQHQSHIMLATRSQVPSAPPGSSQQQQQQQQQQHYVTQGYQQSTNAAYVAASSAASDVLYSTLAPQSPTPVSQFHQEQLVALQACRKMGARIHPYATDAAAKRQNQHTANDTPGSTSTVAGGFDSPRPGSVPPLSVTPFGRSQAVNGPSQGTPGGSTTNVNVAVANGTPTSTAAAAAAAAASSSASSGSDASCLTGLDFGCVGLTKLAPEVFLFDMISNLYLNHNKLSSIPKEISRCRQLTTLNVSGNQLTSLPPELGLCSRLRELLAFDNNISSLPYELGALHKLELFGLEGNPLHDPFKTLLLTSGTRGLIEHLRDNAPDPQPPAAREWHQLGSSINSEHGESDLLTMVTYNVLSERMATPSQYGYVPVSVLSWEYRRDMIMKELAAYNADIVCLQEVESAQYNEFFKDAMRKIGGYDGVFWAKARHNMIDIEQRRTVDGCAVFFKSSMFTRIASQVIEFSQIALHRSDFTRHNDLFNRFNPKDNIAGILILEHKERPGRPRLIVANPHIQWDPEYADVKLVQTCVLLEEIDRIAAKYPLYGAPAHAPPPGPHVPSAVQAASTVSKSSPHSLNQSPSGASLRFPLLICGDFNSTPDSSVYDLLATGRVNASHPDVIKCSTYYKRVSVPLSRATQLLTGSPAVASASSISDISGNTKPPGTDDAAAAAAATAAANEQIAVRHLLPIKSAYSQIGELPFTNYNVTFRGVLDYIWYSHTTFEVTGLLGAVDEEYTKRTVGFPTMHFPSDHITLMAEFKWL
ncbi:hypothetical protein GQ42DRAFT_164478 [Ramicandelaber brevisporus]|nr:hypothetical protein GQ42DRAFT_164478 [Ramicandelaber brevisporus]